MLETTQALFIVLMFAVLIQFCVDRVKEIVGEKVMKYVNAPMWALAFGVLFAFLFELDIFAMLGYTASLQIASKLVTGLILSAGAAPIHELIEKLRQSRLNITDTFGNIGLEQRKAGKTYAKINNAV